MPFYELSNFGYTPRVYGQGDGKENNKKKRIFYRFQSNTIKIVDDVLRNNLNIGVMIDRDYNSLSDDVKKKLRIIHQTAAYPETVELIRSDLNLKIKQKLKKLLLGDYDAKSTDSVAVSKSEGRRFEKFVAEGQDGYIYLRNIIQHEVVPINFDIKK